ncbi:MAG: VOC family protein [Saccharofermentans sp.]|nr:VOC family protein [Saccharofermentans sp.]
MIKGLHHISMKCGTEKEFEEAKAFYIDLLGFKVVRQWPEGIMLDFGNGMLELFSNGQGVRELGAIRHIAFATDDVDGIVSQVKEAGYEVFIDPKDIVIRSDPEFRARMAFCFGPLGEQIEFFMEYT